MTCKITTFKTIKKQLSPEKRGLRESNKTLSQIPRRQDPHLISEPAGRSSGIRHGNYYSKIQGILFKTGENYKCSGSASNDCYFFHCVLRVNESTCLFLTVCFLTNRLSPISSAIVYPGATKVCEPIFTPGRRVVFTPIFE